MHPTVQFIENLPDNAPELIRELNPMTWFERIINEGHQYRLAQLELEKQYAKDRDELKYQLAELETRKQAYIETLNHQIKLIEAENAPVMAVLKAFFNDLDQINARANESHKIIWDNVGRIDVEYFKALIDAHKSIFSQRITTYQQIAQTLDGHHKELSAQRAAIHEQIQNQQNALKKN